MCCVVHCVVYYCTCICIYHLPSWFMSNLLASTSHSYGLRCTQRLIRTSLNSSRLTKPVPDTSILENSAHSSATESSTFRERGREREGGGENVGLGNSLKSNQNRHSEPLTDVILSMSVIQIFLKLY